MSTATLRTSAVRVCTLGILALAILALSSNTCFAQFVIPLPALSGGPATFTIPELPPPGGPEVMTVNIAGGVFTVPPGEIDMVELLGGTQGHLSDRILFDNSGPGGTAMITFLSDDEQGALPLGFPLYPLLLPPGGEGPVSVTLPILDIGSLAIFPLTAFMVSDGDDPLATPPLLPPGISDLLTISVPEPSSVVLAALGLAGLATLAYRRRKRFA